MTTAFVWWAGIMALTWGLVVAARSWRWWPLREDTSGQRPRDLAARAALLPVVVLLGWMTHGAFVALEWTSGVPDPERFLAALPSVVICAVMGLGVACCVRIMAGRRVRSWWLLTGFLPALVGAWLVLGA